MRQTIESTARSLGISNVAVDFYDPTVTDPANAQPGQSGVSIKVGAGDQVGRSEKIITAIIKSKPDRGFIGNWPASPLLMTFVATFMSLAFICAYHVHLGNPVVNAIVSIVLCAFGAFWLLQGVQYAAFDGQSCWFLSIIILGFSSIMGAVNYLTTIVKLRCPGMTMFRMPLSVWSLFITSVLVLLATPVPWPAC